MSELELVALNMSQKLDFKLAPWLPVFELLLVLYVSTNTAESFRMQWSLNHGITWHDLGQYSQNLEMCPFKLIMQIEISHKVMYIYSSCT